MQKTSPGNFFEDFRIGQVIRHATPRTVTVGDVALYAGLFGPRFALQSSDVFAKTIGYPRAPVDDLLVFHIVFGKTVPDVSLNAVANLGYAGCYFRAPVYPGDTLSALSEVIGLKENSSRKTGIVYVRTSGTNQNGASVLEYVRWVMVRKRDEAAPTPGDHVPRLQTVLEPKVLGEACPEKELTQVLAIPDSFIYHSDHHSTHRGPGLWQSQDDWRDVCTPLHHPQSATLGELWPNLVPVFILDLDAQQPRRYGGGHNRCVGCLQPSGLRIFEDAIQR